MNNLKNRSKYIKEQKAIRNTRTTADNCKKSQTRQKADAIKARKNLKKT